MKKLFISSLLFLVSIFANGQNSIEIVPNRTITKGTVETFQTFSTAGNYRGYVGVYSNLADVDFGTGVGTTGKLHLVIGAVPRLTIDNLGNVGVGTTTPSSSYKFNVKGGGFLVENSTSTRSMYYNPNSINDMVFTGGDAFINTNLNASSLKLQVFSNTTLSIGTQLPSSGKVQISHLASSSSPTLHLKSTGPSSSIIRATSTAIGSEWDNHFVNNAFAGANLVYWTNSINSSTPLILTGAGDALVERNLSAGGFTRLGTGAPNIKMKKLTSTTNAAQGGFVTIAHGLTASKIISVNVLVRYNGAAADAWVANGYTSAAGFEFDYQYDGPNVIVFNKAGNSSAILSKDIKIVVTYEE